MGESGYFDRIWASVPAGLEPERFALRREFLLAGVAAGERVLDVGCGEGAFTAALAAHGAAPIGIEVAAEPLRRAAAAHPDLDLRLVDAAASLQFGDASFDVVWAGEVLEHVVDVVGLLDELWRVLGDRGRLLASTPNHPRAKLLWLAVSARAFDAHFDPRADHVRFFSARTLRLVLESARFDRVRVRAGGGAPGFTPVLLATAHKPPA
jgi:2-polyprenyl-3-methyl-5-hydroxy-6-metoxy-1,4-benzoquinol methylase